MNDQYRSPRNLSYFAIASLAACAILDFFSGTQGLALLASPDMTLDLEEGGSVSLWLILYGLMAVLKLPAIIIAIIAFLCWLYRAHSNLTYLKPTHLEFTPGWAVGWWFVPFLNLFKPFQVVREVWWESDPDVPEGSSFLSASLHSAPAYMGFWWVFWIISNVMENIASRVYDPDSLQGLQTFGLLAILSGITGIIAAALAIMVVRDITTRQDMRFEAVRKINMDMPPPPPPSFGGQ